MIGSWARQVNDGLAEMANEEQVGYVRDYIVLGIPAYYLGGPGSIPDRGIKFLG